MAKLIYTVITSLDGFFEDTTGKFDWAEPDEEVHRFINDLMLPVGTYLYGRRMYETMVVWETDPSLEAISSYIADFACIWRAAEKIVYSTTLEEVLTHRTRIERHFDPEAIRAMKAVSKSDLGIGGLHLAESAFRAGLVDECHYFIAPVAVGGGKPSLPRDLRLKLELLDEHRFGNGMVYLRYRISI